MSKAILEHVNLTVSDPDKTAQMLAELFGWKVRWSGPSLGNGRTVHVGNDDDYVALYSRGTPRKISEDETYALAGAINHLGILVDDLDAAEQKVLDFGIKTHSHQTYEPGSRFYFHDHDGIEYEVVSYA
ncbi:MAG: VOC family protein [Hyphomonadaceae bacterium]|nr:VOC family protein [Hyphomonadaceae bacterium]